MDTLIVDATDMYFRNKRLDYTKLLNFLSRVWSRKVLFICDERERTKPFQLFASKLGFEIIVLKQTARNCSVAITKYLYTTELQYPVFIVSGDKSLRDVAVNGNIVSVGYEKWAQEHIFLYKGLELDNELPH
jgi:hypothetical protein